MGSGTHVCTSCDTPLPPEAKFCLNCGAPTPTESGREATAAQPAEVQVERLRTALADRYRIERVLGYGGMATVYLADDLRHDRKVAVKVLRPELAAAIGPERFLREIRIAAKLQHPHILMLIDSGEADGFLYFVMPLVEGESLRQRLSRERELPLAEAVRILRDVVDALAYAHGQGVVHRDIKPDNVMLSGRHALVVDFGVAKAASQATGEFAPTTAGLSLGTPAYMSPEQAAADPKIDHRADIYAVGAMAYELLTGEPPIRGHTPQAVLAAQVTETPKPVHEVRPSVPMPLAQLVMRCLEKRPADRWQRAEDLLPQLEALTTPSLGMTPSTTPVIARRRGWMPWVGAVAVVGVVAALGVLLTRDRGSPSLSPPPEFRQVTFEGNVRTADLSPDGQLLAYLVQDGVKPRIMVRDLVGGSSLLLADSISPSSAGWSPDGARYAVAGYYRGELGVYVFPRLGGPPQRAPIYLPHFAWSPDGTRMAGWVEWVRGGIRVFHLGSDALDSLAIPGTDEWTLHGAWAPHADLLALVTKAGDNASSHLWVIDLATETHVLTLTDSTGALSSVEWAPNGDALYFAQGEDLFRIAVDRRDGRAGGEPEPVLRLEGGTPFSLSPAGRRLAYVRRSGSANFSLAWVEGGRVEQVVLTTGTAGKSCPTLSPDGTALAFVQESVDGRDLYRVSADGGTPERLTFDGSVLICPAWGPSGWWLAYGARAVGMARVAIIVATGGAPRIVESTRMGQSLYWAPGPHIAYQAPGNRNFRLLDPESQEERLLVPNDSVGWMFNALASPEGTHMAVFWNRPGRGLWLVSLQDSSQVRRVEGRWYPIGWSADGRNIYARNADGTLKRFPAAGGEGVVMQPPDVGKAFCLPYERPQGLVWLCTESQSFSDVWMVENFDPEYARRSR